MDDPSAERTGASDAPPDSEALTAVGAGLPAELEFLGEEPPEFVPGGAPESPEQALEILTNLLLATNQPLTQQRLQNLLGGLSAECLKSLLAVLEERIAALGLQLDKVAGGFQLASQPRYAEWVWKLSRPKQRVGITPQSMEVLGIVAYKQPVTKSEVDVIRGMDSGNILRHLVDIEMIEIRGRKDVPGRPLLYGTTTQFLKTFGLNKIDELPSVQDLKKIYSERERERAEAEAQAAHERRIREHEEALEAMTRYKPPVTELARALSDEEKNTIPSAGPEELEEEDDEIAEEEDELDEDDLDDDSDDEDDDEYDEDEDEEDEDDDELDDEEDEDEEDEDEDEDDEYDDEDDDNLR